MNDAPHLSAYPSFAMHGATALSTQLGHFQGTFKFTATMGTTHLNYEAKPYQKQSGGMTGRFPHGCTAATKNGRPLGGAERRARPDHLRIARAVGQKCHEYYFIIHRMLASRQRRNTDQKLPFAGFAWGQSALAVPVRLGRGAPVQLLLCLHHIC